MPEIPPEVPPKIPTALPAKDEPVREDPVITHSYAGWLLVSSFLLLVTVGWSLYAEFFGLRPWRDYQRRFGDAYTKYLKGQIKDQRKLEDQVYASADYKKLKGIADQAAQATAAQDRSIAEQIAMVDDQRAAIADAFRDSRGRVGSLIYQYQEVPVSDKSEKQSRLEKLNTARKLVYKVDWPLGGGRVQSDKEFNYDSLTSTFTGLIAQRARLVEQRGEIDKPAHDAQAALADYVSTHLVGLSSATLDGLLHSAENLNVTLRQVNVNPTGAQINWVGGAGLVDRCQSCHVGTDPALVPAGMVLTKADLGMAKSHDVPFTSHPDAELLADHPLEKFGCSPCHGGNGRALDSVEKAHGRYEHWLWPLFYPENYNAGCQQCHASDMVTEHGDVINEGRQLYRQRGCIGCHRYQGFDNQDEQLINARQELHQLATQKTQNELEIPRLQKRGDQAPDNVTAQRLYAEATDLTVTDSRMDGQLEQLLDHTHNLLQEVKKVGPDLKEVRMKLNKDWIPYWIGYTHEFRPTTKMPQFRLSQDQIQAIAAFIWQSGLTGPPLDAQNPGDAGHGKQLFESRGCLACHSIGEGAALMGGTFAANLSRVAEKENYNYLVRWIHDPRQRTRPYCPLEKRDIGPEDYAKHNLPYVFDLDHSRCPNDGTELEVQQPTVMPSLRLTMDDSRDIASYLMTQKHSGMTYASADYMDNPALAVTGKALVRNFGCASCHEISGMEDEGRIGTELTNEGSKPVERLDFALYTTDAKRGILPDGKESPRGPWYDSKGFFDQKLANPAIYDQGKFHSDPLEALRMPMPSLHSKEERDAVVTFLLGSVDPSLPSQYMYQPTDRRKAIQDGWWIVTKYNCIGCHQIDIGQKSVMMTLPMYQGDAKANLPPVLTSEGARVNPEWLKGFLANPSLSATDTNRNGVRQYLQVRMPTFYLSNDEIRKLVLFFEASSAQAQPYIAPQVPSLTTEETAMARSLFTNPAAPCLKCHMDGNPAHDLSASAPNFLLARDRLRLPWTERWVVEPASIIPGTAMPSGLFRRENGRWVFNGPLPPALQQYPGDHADLLVRYMFQMTPQEQAALVGKTPAPPRGTAAHGAAAGGK
jgi:cytochrome c551/c552